MNSTKLFLLVILFLTSCATPATSVPVPPQTFTPEPTATQTSIATPTITPAPTQVGGGSGRFIFTYRKDEFLASFPNLEGETNVFVANIDGTNLTPITNGLDGIIYLKDISPDGTKVLITSTSDYENTDAVLYLVNLNSLDSEPTKLADGLPNYYGNNLAAKWINDSQIVYIGQGEAGFGVYTINSDGTNLLNIDKGNIPIEILTVDSTRVYWGTETNTKLCDSAIEVWWSDLNGGERTPLMINEKQAIFCNVFSPDLVFSPDGSKIAWVSGATGPDDPYPYLNIASVSDINNPYTMETLTGFMTLRWFPDESKLLVFDSDSTSVTVEDYEKYYQQRLEKPLGNSVKDLYGIYEVPLSTNLPIRNYNFTTEVMGSSFSDAFIMQFCDISPDGRQVISSTYERNDQGDENVTIKLLTIETLVFSEAISGFTFTNPPIDCVHWIP